VTANTWRGPISLSYVYPLNNIGPSYYGGYSPDPGYMTGGSSYDSYFGQQGLANAQQAGAQRAPRRDQDEARGLIDAQWAYEKLGVTGLEAIKSAKLQPEELQKALSVRDESEVASGDAMNRILVAIVVAEGKGAKGAGAFLPPQLLDDIRFTGGSKADLLNLVRQSGTIPFPPNFPGPSLAELQTQLEADFAAAINPLRVGKPVELGRVSQLESTLKKLNDAAPPVIRALSFEDAIAARKFLNGFNSAMAALKGPDRNSLVNPKWASDGASVGDLVQFMTKNKLMFAPAPAGNEPSYFSVHKSLATYLLLLTQVKR
jgi:hypothetical protein